MPVSDEHVHFKLSCFPEHDLEFGLSLFPNDGGSESARNANNELVDDAENSGGRNSEEVGIKMDLSDDLLHLVWPEFLFPCLYSMKVMIDFFCDLKCTNFLGFPWQIFSFLGQKDLCSAGVACKQWRSASVHGDFWKCLKFENTRISLQNCKSLYWFYFLPSHFAHSCTE